MLKIFLRKNLALRLFWYPFPDPKKEDTDQQGWQDEPVQGLTLAG